MRTNQIWEQLHYADFNPVEFDGIKRQAGLNSFTFTPKPWIEKTATIRQMQTLTARTAKQLEGGSE